MPASDDVAISSVIQPLPQLPEEPPLVLLGAADTAGLAPDNPVILVIVIILRVSSQHGPVLYCTVLYCTALYYAETCCEIVFAYCRAPPWRRPGWGPPPRTAARGTQLVEDVLLSACIT